MPDLPPGGFTNAELKEAIRESRLKSASQKVARTILDLAPGEVLEVHRNPNDAEALITVARYSVLTPPESEPGG